MTDDVMIEMAKDSDKLESEIFIAKVNNIPWPTLRGRLDNALTDEKKALIQLAKSVPLSDIGKKRLNELTKPNKSKL